MDLIDRDAVKEKKVYSKERHEKVVSVAEIDWMPTIEAVPLEPLCEWLARSALFNTGYRNKIGASMWKELIKREVMEELHGRSD